MVDIPIAVSTASKKRCLELMVQRNRGEEIAKEDIDKLSNLKKEVVVEEEQKLKNTSRPEVISLDLLSMREQSLKNTGSHQHHPEVRKVTI